MFDSVSGHRRRGKYPISPFRSIVATVALFLAAGCANMQPVDVEANTPLMGGRIKTGPGKPPVQPAVVIPSVVSYLECRAEEVAKPIPNACRCARLLPGGDPGNRVLPRGRSAPGTAVRSRADRRLVGRQLSAVQGSDRLSGQGVRVGMSTDQPVASARPAPKPKSTVTTAYAVTTAVVVIAGRADRRRCRVLRRLGHRLQNRADRGCRAGGDRVPAPRASRATRRAGRRPGPSRNWNNNTWKTV